MIVYTQITVTETRLNNRLFRINHLQIKIKCNKVQKNRTFHNNLAILIKLQLEDQGLQLKLVTNPLQIYKVLNRLLFLQLSHHCQTIKMHHKILLPNNYLHSILPNLKSKNQFLKCNNRIKYNHKIKFYKSLCIKLSDLLQSNSLLLYHLMLQFLSLKLKDSIHK